MPEKLKYNNKNIKNEKDKDKDKDKENEKKNENIDIDIDNEKLVKIFIKNCYHYTNFLDDLDN